jgi:ring-1,2-phenylacetyl-CoA epoxidase subunit PaaE
MPALSLSTTSSAFNAVQYHPLKVIAVEPTAQDAACVTLAIPDELAETFAFRAGQYVSVRRLIEGTEEQRTYSIASMPGQRHLKLGIRAQPEGGMSHVLNHALQVGDLLHVAKPMGRFSTPREASRQRRYVAFAAGSGITPILSVVADILQHEPRSRLLLVYGNRSLAHTMLLEEILALKDRYLDRLSLHFIMSRERQDAELFNGRIDAAKVAELANRIGEIRSADEYFVCGPGTMLDEVSNAIRAINVESTIRLERFATGAPAPVPRPKSVGSADEVLARIGVTADGRRREFDMTTADNSVLDAAERAGLALPFSCRSGICATCRVKITSGAALMMHNIALEPWETEAGFVLCCQAKPTSTVLELNYDQK